MTRPRAATSVERLTGQAAALGLTLLLAACGSTPGPTASASPARSTAPGSTTAPGGASVLPSASAPASTGPGPSLDGGSDVAADQTLLSFVPASGDDLQVNYDPRTTADVARDPALRASASGLAIAIFTPRSTSASPVPFDDLAVVSVIRLRDPSLDDAWFRDWRDSYDGAACANAGGVTRHAQTDIGGHTVFVGSCAGGAFTYHTRLAGGGIVISLTSIGPARVGETIMERLAP